MSVVLYTTHCGRCEVLAKKLKEKNVEFEVVEGVEPIKKLGFMEAPLLVVDGDIMNFSNAVSWINNL